MIYQYFSGYPLHHFGYDWKEYNRSVVRCPCLCSEHSRFNVTEVHVRTVYRERPLGFMTTVRFTIRIPSNRLFLSKLNFSLALLQLNGH